MVYIFLSAGILLHGTQRLRVSDRRFQVDGDIHRQMDRPWTNLMSFVLSSLRAVVSIHGLFCFSSFL